MAYVFSSFEIRSFAGEGEANVVENNTTVLSEKQSRVLYMAMSDWFDTYERLGAFSASPDFVKDETVYPTEIFFGTDPVRKMQVGFMMPGTENKKDPQAAHTVFEVTASFPDQEMVDTVRMIKLGGAEGSIEISDLVDLLILTKKHYLAQL